MSEAMTANRNKCNIFLYIAKNMVIFVTLIYQIKSNQFIKSSNPFKHELQIHITKGSKHTICPNCQKKTFKPYVDSVTGEGWLVVKYG